MFAHASRGAIRASLCTQPCSVPWQCALAVRLGSSATYHTWHYDTRPSREVRWCPSSRPREDGPSPARRSSFARARTNSNSTLTRGGDATNPSPRHTQPRAHTLPLISNPQARDRKTISCLFVVRWTDTHSHQHLACDYWESTN